MEITPAPIVPYLITASLYQREDEVSYQAISSCNKNVIDLKQENNFIETVPINCVDERNKKLTP